MNANSSRDERQLGAQVDRSTPCERDNGLPSKLSFTTLENILLFCSGLTDGEKIVYSVLRSFDWVDRSGRRKGYVFPSLELLAYRSNKSRSQVSRILAALKRKGLIRTRRRGANTSVRYLAPIDQVDWLALYGQVSSDRRDADERS